MKALILIDIQNDYFENGANPLIGSDEASNRAKEILFFFRKEKQPIIHVQHISIRAGSSFFLEGTYGAEIHKNVAPMVGEKVIVKHYPNAFKETTLQEYLKFTNINDLVICGMMTHMCIDSSIRAAKDYGFNIQLINDACATKDLKWNETVIPASSVHSSFLAALNNTFATVVPSWQFLKEQQL